MDKQWTTRFLEQHPPNKKLKKPIEKIHIIVEIVEKTVKVRAVQKRLRKELCKEVKMKIEVWKRLRRKTTV